MYMFDGIVICLFQAQKEELNLEEKVERAKEKIRQLESTWLSTISQIHNSCHDWVKKEPLSHEKI